MEEDIENIDLYPEWGCVRVWIKDEHGQFKTVLFVSANPDSDNPIWQQQVLHENISEHVPRASVGAARESNGGLGGAARGSPLEGLDPLDESLPATRTRASLDYNDDRVELRLSGYQEAMANSMTKLHAWCARREHAQLSADEMHDKFFDTYFKTGQVVYAKKSSIDNAGSGMFASRFFSTGAVVAVLGSDFTQLNKQMVQWIAGVSWNNSHPRYKGYLANSCSAPGSKSFAPNAEFRTCLIATREGTRKVVVVVARESIYKDHEVFTEYQLPLAEPEWLE